MIRASGQDSAGHPIAIAGLSEENVAAMKAGRPIHVPMPPLAGISKQWSLCVMYGVTEQDITDELVAGGLFPGDTPVIDPRRKAEIDARKAHDHVLICTVGLPGSGKLEWARDSTYPVVSPEAVHLALHGKPFDRERSSEVTALMQIMVRALFGAGHKIVVAEITGVDEKRRNEWRDGPWGLYFKEFDTPVEVCQGRYAGDERMPGVIRLLAEMREPLTETDRRWP